MKKCSKCSEIKTVNEFHKNRSECKECAKIFYINNKEKINKRNAEYKIKHKEKWIEYHRSYSLQYKIDNKEQYDEYGKKWRGVNREYLNNYSKNYVNENREKVNKRRRIYQKNKYKTDPIFKIKNLFRTRLNESFKFIKHRKNTKSSIILGCTFEQFKNYIEAKFEPWMSWENHGICNGELNSGWDLDHIIPISSAKNIDDTIRLNHYTNFQPLCSYVNRNIKRNNIT